MASAAVDCDAISVNAGGRFLQLDSVPIVDLRLLSQSELYSLSLCSSSAFDPRRCDDVVIPKIDRSVFNESAGSRKQTYSRFRLAPSSSSSSAIPRRRTPHLRPTSTSVSFLGNSLSDPESSENIQIVNLLKRLFVADINLAELSSVEAPEQCSTIPLSYPSDLNPVDLVSVEIDYPDHKPIEHLHDSLLPVSSSSNSNLTANKRKRGRPPRNDNLPNERELAVVASDNIDLDEGMDRLSSANEIVAWENMEVVKDRDILNKDGVAVDLVALGLVEHPYVEEIRRRTESFGTEEEFFTFLEGLNGQWGSKRKRKRIVDASEFGSALPTGWKLSLCINKKERQIWLYCRRYISPSGLHFVSCKGVSSYLLSLHGIHDNSAWYTTPSNEIFNDADKLTSAYTIADLPMLDESLKQNLVSHSQSPAVNFTSVNHVMEAAVSTVDLPQRQVGEAIRCKKCNLTFSGENELLLHQATAHRRRRSRNGMRITDGVIIRDGKFECQFCHKIFNERHRYTGHVGTHVKYQGKNAGESSSGGLNVFENLSSCSELPVQDPMHGRTLKSNSDGTDYDEILNEQRIHNKNNEHVGMLPEADGDTRGTYNATDGKISFLEDEGRNVSAGLIQDWRSSGNCLPFRPDDDTHGPVHSGVIENSSHRENLEQTFLSNGKLEDSKNSLEEYEVGNERTLECENDIVTRSESESFGSHGVPKKDFYISAVQHKGVECFPLDISIIDTTAGSETSKLDTDSKPNKLPKCSDKKECLGHSFHCSIPESMVDEICRLGASDEGHAKAGNTQFGCNSNFSLWNEQESTSQKGGTLAIMSQLKDSGKRNASERRLEVPPSHETMYSSENNVIEVSGRKMEVDRSAHFQQRVNGELNDPFKSVHSGMHTNSSTRTYQASKDGVSSAFTFDKMFAEDNAIGVFNNVVGGLRQRVESSLDLLFGQSGDSDASDGGFVLDTAYSDLSSHARLDENEKHGKHDLSLASGDSQTERRTDSNRVEKEKYQADQFNIQSHVYKTYGDQAHLRVIDSPIPGGLKLGIPQGFDFRDSSFDTRTHHPGSNFNMSRPKRDWNGPIGDKVVTSNQNFVENNSSLSGEFLNGDVSWSSSYENGLQRGFASASSQHIPSPNHFGTFGVPANKCEQDPFKAIGNDFTHSEMLRQENNEPVEYSFMGEPSSSILHGGSKSYCYNANMGQEPPDLPFWLEKGALMMNAGAPMGQATTSHCVWCRNMFFHEPIQPGMQTGAIGTMCPSCSSRIPGQFNML